MPSKTVLQPRGRRAKVCIGYYLKPRESFFVVSRDYLTEAHSIFDELGVNRVTNHRFLGGVVGNEEGKADFVKHCVSMVVSVGYSDRYC